jgi:hypothetical protein
MFLGHLELVAKEMQCSFYCDYADVEILWIRPNFIFGQSGSWCVNHIACRGNYGRGLKLGGICSKPSQRHPLGTGACRKFCNSITGVVLLFDHIRCPLRIGSVETFSDSTVYGWCPVLIIVCWIDTDTKFIKRVVAISYLLQPTVHMQFPNVFVAMCP